MKNEKKFYDKLNDVFIGAKIEGEGGFVNLMRIKSNYYKKISVQLKKDIDVRLINNQDFKEDLFLHLYNFFDRYFTESGSIYFDRTAYHNKVYERVYTDERDVILFWKTHMLYYVKTDRIFKSLPITFDGLKFFFDASKVESKKSNEKRSLIYNFKEIRSDGTVVFLVEYSERGKVTKTDEILKKLKKSDVKINEDILERAFRIFERQSEIDFFINKNANEFLREQFKLWQYQYLFDDDSVWKEKRIKELQILKDTAFDIIDYVSQFEDELVMVWNKPKFVRKSNYVVTLDRLAVQENSIKIIKKIFKHKGFKEQVKEWKELGIVNDKFKPENILVNELKGETLAKEYEKLPIDTKYFKELEIEILGLFDNLDKSLDGWLIKSENYQALNTIKNKFKGQVQTIYIDPPFNLGKNADYFYNVNYKDSSWATLLENRYYIAKEILSKSGSFFTRCDNNGNMYARMIMDTVFGEENFRNEITIRKTTSLSKREVNNLERETESLYHYSISKDKMIFNQLMEDRKAEWVIMQEKPNRGQTGKPIIIGNRIFKPREGWCWARGSDVANDMYKKGRLRIENEKLLILLDKKIIGSNWTDVTGYTSNWKFNTENSEKMLKRVIELTSNKNQILLDYFVGIGSSIATSHKLSRKWIGIDMGDQFYRFETDKEPSGILVRMKEVLAGKGNHEPCGISKMLNWKGGGFFKYYELEQYEEALNNCKYEDGDVFERPGESPYNEYVFMKDQKMLKAIEIDYKKNKVNVVLSKLYKDIDIAETLSNLTGKWIKRITVDEIEFEDGDKINIKALEYKLIKPLIWWER